MPELPEVETVKKGLEDILVNKTIKGIILSGFSLRFPIPKNLVSLASGKKIVSIARRSKYILFNLSENFLEILVFPIDGPKGLMFFILSLNILKDN